MQEPLQKLVAERKKMAEEKAAAEVSASNAIWVNHFFCVLFCFLINTLFHSFEEMFRINA